MDQIASIGCEDHSSLNHQQSLGVVEVLHHHGPQERFSKLEPTKQQANYINVEENLPVFQM